ncbi:DNA-binding response regulator [Chryseomicrobium excrementi]|uniref:DNA-binding response regulator n=1 Tax=Chryseomicrobium excrementi TaxID=2041346 RepID=A0A2M9F3R2_9BACL|nr:response regulator transcription factor [Chryseomicrobium excrementi]PJK18100.1 DNA-binding response regulator [Chryseomicrobium excrementi]
MTTILVVDDEYSMRRLLDLQLSQKGYHVVTVASGKEALHTLQTVVVDLILVDGMMPEMDGFALSEAIRNGSEVPILFVTALDDRDSKLKGFEVGVDDYVTKPFDSEELHARIQAILKRAQKIQSPVSEMTRGELTLNLTARSVVVAGKRVQVTMKELELLALLMRSEGRAFSREELLAHIWGEHYEGTTRTVDTHIKTLRIKLGPPADQYIHTVWGIGYKFEVVS